MNLIDLFMAIPLAIAIEVLCLGTLLLLVYIVSIVMDDNNIIVDFVHGFTTHYKICILGFFVVSYVITVILLYRTFIY